MGSNQFQREYIEYLQERNTELLNRLNHMKENYESKILSKDINKHYLISTLEDILSICTVIPQEIDLFFDKMTAAMGAFKNILLRKSEMVQMVEKITKAIHPDNFENDLYATSNLGLLKEQISEGRVGKKGGTVKVSPMINGHIISTEPRIYLSRVPGVFTPGKRNEQHHLSPIIEASPDTSSDPTNVGSHIFREIKIPLERINLSKITYNYMSEDSPKSRFKGPKTWKKSLSSNKHQTRNHKNTVYLDNNENLNKKLSMGEIETPENIDPLEGPSWLYEENSEMNSSQSRFIDFRRRKHRFATVFDKNEDCITYLDKESKKPVEKSPDEFYENLKETDDEEEDFDKHIRNRVSESSEDYIHDSFTSECDENYSTLKKGCYSSSRRKSNEILNDKKDYTEFKSIKEEISVTFTKNKRSSSNPLACSDSSDEDDNEKPKHRKIKKSSSKRSFKSSFQRMPMELVSGKTSSKFDNNVDEEEEATAAALKKEQSQNLKRSNSLIKSVLKNDVYVKLEDCMATKEVIPKKSKTRSSGDKKKFKKSKSKSQSRSPVVFLQENEGRKKRKAAPSFKLVEPKLKTKLRRS